MRINLRRDFFAENEHELLTFGDIKVTAYKYKTGVEALRVENCRGHIIFLPFLAQQIWRIVFDGKDLAMETPLKEPVYSKSLMENYGMFLYHCGLTGCGAPQAEDKHPQHGELPYSIFDKAHIECGEDENGKFIKLGGEFEYNVVYSAHYLFHPEIKLYENDTKLRVSVSFTNLCNAPLEYMYLCHINYRPIDGAELIYSAPKDKEHITVHKGVFPDTPQDKADAVLAYMDKVQENPELHHIVGAEGTVFDPEICMTIKYKGDENNRAYTMQYKRGEGACFVNHPVDALPLPVRWISRTEDVDSMGMILPASAQHMGRAYAKRNGLLKSLAKGETASFYMEAGWLSDDEAKEMESKIQKMLG